MALSLLLLLTLTASSHWVQSSADDLAALTSSDASARELATRRLCGSLAREHHDDLLELAKGADHELERRITRVLAARDERLGLAVTLMTSTDRRARTIGRSAFHEHLVRWSPDYDDAPLPSHKARHLIREAQTGLISAPACEGVNAELLERLAEGAEFGVPLVLDPGVEAGLEASWEGAVGSALDHLERSCLGDGLSYELRGPESRDGVIHRELGHWLRVCRGRDAVGAPTQEVLISWALEVAAGGEGAARAARALATTGWTAPIAWFEERWRVERDPVALSGLLAAAARGRVSLVLTEAETQVEVRGLLDQVAIDPLSAGAAREVERIARGMAQAGARAPEGEDPSVIWAEETSESSSLARWARLLVLEGHRRGDLKLTREVLKSGGAEDLALWRRALGAYVSDPLHAPLQLSLKGLNPALEGAHRDGLARSLFLAGLRARDLNGVEGVGLLRAELSLRAGADGACGADLLDAWRSATLPEAEVEALLSSWCSEFGRGRVARALGDLSAQEGERGRWERLLELSGVKAPGDSGDYGEDLQRIACRAGQSEGALVRGLLLEELEGLDLEDQGRLREFSEAWRRVGWALQEAGEEDTLKTFAAQTRLLIRDLEAQQELLESFPPTPRGRLKSLDVGLLRSEGSR
jgi:hypothetical protein